MKKCFYDVNSSSVEQDQMVNNKFGFFNTLRETLNHRRGTFWCGVLFLDIDQKIVSNMDSIMLTYIIRDIMIPFAKDNLPVT